MAAPCMASQPWRFYKSVRRCVQQSPPLLTPLLTPLLVPARLLSSSSGSPSLISRALLLLSQRFYDVEKLMGLKSRLKGWNVERKNGPNNYARNALGVDVALAHFVLSMKGSVRFVGQDDWFRVDKRGKFSWDFLSHKNTPIEEVDLSHSLVNFTGLLNLDGQQSLRTLSLRGCSQVDDWCLAKLHMVQDTLEELDISDCPQITVGGLAALRNLKGLRRLDISSLPRISSPGLVIIMLEEMLPHCHIVATGYDFSLGQNTVEEEKEPGRMDSGCRTLTGASTV